jgi:hypothetical protein
VPRSVYPAMVNAGNGGLRTHFTLTFNIKMTGPLNTVPIVLYILVTALPFFAPPHPRECTTPLPSNPPPRCHRNCSAPYVSKHARIN